MDFDDLQKQLHQIMDEQNNRSIPEFEGYSPLQMHQILHFTFGEESPIKLLKLSGSEYKKIPILNQITYLTELIAKSGEMTLTKKGFLPTRIVSELYQQGFLKEKYIESGLTKLYKETDSLTVHLTRLLMEVAGLVKKRNGKLRLTKRGEKLRKDQFALLKTLLETYTSKFNWAYLDGYGENHIGQLGVGFSLILLAKYGQEKRLDVFYARKYFTAHPHLLEAIEPTYGTLERYATQCYSLRTFEQFFNSFGLINLEQEDRGFDTTLYVTKTDLFDQVFQVSPPSAKEK